MAERKDGIINILTGVTAACPHIIIERAIAPNPRQTVVSGSLLLLQTGIHSRTNPKNPARAPVKLYPSRKAMVPTKHGATVRRISSRGLEIIGASVQNTP